MKNILLDVPFGEVRVSEIWLKVLYQLLVHNAKKLFCVVSYKAEYVLFCPITPQNFIIVNLSDQISNKMFWNLNLKLEDFLPKVVLPFRPTKCTRAHSSGVFTDIFYETNSFAKQSTARPFLRRYSSANSACKTFLFLQLNSQPFLNVANITSEEARLLKMTGADVSDPLK